MPKTISNSICVNTIEDGQQGKRGRAYYYAGVWESTPSNQTFPISDIQAPFFKYTLNNQTRYALYDAQTNGNYTKSQMTPQTQQGKPDTNASGTSWKVMTNDFKYLITEAIFGDFAKFGSAIISGDWMLSAHGVIYDTTGTEHEIYSNASSGDGTWTNNNVLYNADNAYRLFNEDYPNTNEPNSLNFVPNYCVDLLTGSTYQHNAYVDGSLYAKSLQTTFQDIPYRALTQNELVIGCSTWMGNDSNDIKIDVGIWNYAFPDGDILVCLPTNQYQYIGQRVTLFNPKLPANDLSLVSIVSQAAIYDSTEDAWYIDENADKQVIRGIGLPPTGNPPYQWGSYRPIYKLNFIDGLAEFMCVPTYDTSNPSHLCDWCLINICATYYQIIYHPTNDQYKYDVFLGNN